MWVRCLFQDTVIVCSNSSYFGHVGKMSVSGYSDGLFKLQLYWSCGLDVCFWIQWLFVQTPAILVMWVRCLFLDTVIVCSNSSYLGHVGKISVSGYSDCLFKLQLYWSCGLDVGFWIQWLFVQTPAILVMWVRCLFLDTVIVCSNSSYFGHVVKMSVSGYSDCLFKLQLFWSFG